MDSPGATGRVAHIFATDVGSPAGQICAGLEQWAPDRGLHRIDWLDSIHFVHRATGVACVRPHDVHRPEMASLPEPIQDIGTGHLERCAIAHHGLTHDNLRTLCIDRGPIILQTHRSMFVNKRSNSIERMMLG